MSPANQAIKTMAIAVAAALTIEFILTRRPPKQRNRQIAQEEIARDPGLGASSNKIAESLEAVRPIKTSREVSRREGSDYNA